MAERLSSIIKTDNQRLEGYPRSSNFVEFNWHYFTNVILTTGTLLLFLIPLTQLSWFTPSVWSLFEKKEFETGRAM